MNGDLVGKYHAMNGDLSGILAYTNGDLRIFCVYMNGDLRYTFFRKAVLYMDKPVFKRKIYDEILEWKEKRSDKYALLIKGACVKIGLNQEKPYK